MFSLHRNTKQTKLNNNNKITNFIIIMMITIINELEKKADNTKCTSKFHFMIITVSVVAIQHPS